MPLSFYANWDILVDSVSGVRAIPIIDVDDPWFPISNAVSMPYFNVREWNEDCISIRPVLVYVKHGLMCHRFTCKPLLSFLDIYIVRYNGIFPWRMQYFEIVCVWVCVSMYVYLNHLQNDVDDVYYCMQ